MHINYQFAQSKKKKKNEIYGSKINFPEYTEGEEDRMPTFLST